MNSMSQAPPSNRPTPTAEKLLFGRYRVQEQLGETRLSTVFRAMDERLQRPVLVHLLRKDLVGQAPLRQRFLDEATASARRSHPALLEVFDSGEVVNRPFMITEFATGRPLRALGLLTLEDALLYVRQVVGAVATCQAAGVPHPPISSSNVLLVDEGRVKLVESWLTPPDAVALDLAHYRAPERSQGQSPTPANAVYALGLLLYELITGKRPITGPDPRAVIAAHLTTRIASLSEVRPLLYLPALERLLARATARAPEQRPPDAAALADALDALRREVGADTDRLAAPPAPQRGRRLARDAGTVRADETAVHVASQGQSPQHRPTLPDAVPVFAQPAGPMNVDSTTSANRAKLHQSAQRAFLGWAVALLLLLGVVYGSYVGASYVVDRFFEISLPQISLPFTIPWWTGGEETLVVNAEGLNVRDQPGTQGAVRTTLLKGTRVVKLEGPRTVGDTPWVRVRAVVNDQTIEGWVSLKYLETT